jgi:hypothetical protein
MNLAWRIVGLVFLLSGCAEEYVLFHSQSGDPILISRRSYSYDDCVTRVKEDLARLGATARYVHVRGTVFGRSLLWPFEPGYACEAAVGPEQAPAGYYLNSPKPVPFRS